MSDRLLARLGLIKFDETELPAVFRRVSDFAHEGLPSADYVSVTVMTGRRPYTAAYTDETALRLDELQYQGQLGPCLQAAAERSTVLVPDTAEDTRWNRWPLHAARAGAGSVLSVPMPILGDVSGALNIYGRPSGAFDDDAVQAAQTFAGHATVFLANAHLYDRTVRLARQMRDAMENRAVIEQAKGIVMAERRCGADDAFAFLTKISQDSNRKLRDVATALVARTQSPEEGTAP
ncbi:GAF and ANTAR domain-containing protein [Actinoplanes sp. M2I2]|uniref:GAF and ANTAR domain-containing protein n=1 Tax=Actinoplanes sp. M2I2 TaxID=1734444 RepID=UPI0027DF3DBA|nr:GAF and ANTAR domain-containing protein [Actinoplanes sp. M2I2]